MKDMTPNFGKCPLTLRVGREFTVLSVESPGLRLVRALLIASCLVLAFLAFQSAWMGNPWPLLTAVALWLPLAWGLWRRHPLARRVAQALLWLIVIVLPIGLINPFAAMDGLVSGSIWALAVPVYGIVAVALFCLHILGKHKEACRHGG
jgi:hypothetical protein